MFICLNLTKNPRCDISGGCSSFGHSCFGGHGKRSSESVLPDQQQPIITDNNLLGQQDIPRQDNNIIPLRQTGLFYIYSNLYVVGEERTSQNVEE